MRLVGLEGTCFRVLQFTFSLYRFRWRNSISLLINECQMTSDSLKNIFVIRYEHSMLYSCKLTYK